MVIYFNKTDLTQAVRSQQVFQVGYHANNKVMVRVRKNTWVRGAIEGEEVSQVEE